MILLQVQVHNKVYLDGVLVGRGSKTHILSVLVNVKTCLMVCLYEQNLSPTHSTLVSCSKALRHVDAVLMPAGALQYNNQTNPNNNH